jgi:glycosyltransferase involved in cell wall biosynthesis
LQPLVSIGIPTYNRPEGLEKALKYLINQCYKNLEIIVSDNCSTNPDVKKILAHYSTIDDRIIFFTQKENILSEPNFNFVFHQAKGNYFMWIADDDDFDDNYISECVSFLELHQDYVLCSGVSAYYKGDQLLFRENRIELSNNNPFFRLFKYYKKVFKNGVFYGVYRNNLGFINPIQNHVAGDWNHIARTALLGKIQVLDSITVKRSDDGGSSSRGKMTTRWHLKGIKKLFFETYTALQIVKYLFNEPIFKKKYSSLTKGIIQAILFFMLNLKFLIHSIKIRIK